MSDVAFGGRVQVGLPVANLDAKYGPYNSKQQAIAALGESGMDVIADGLTVGIIEKGKVVEYWFQGGVTEEYLVPKIRNIQVCELSECTQNTGIPVHWKNCMFEYEGEPVCQVPLAYDGANCLLVYAHVFIDEEEIEKAYMISGRVIVDIWDGPNIPDELRRYIPELIAKDLEDAMFWH